MTGPFHVVYRSEGPLDVRLEAAEADAYRHHRLIVADGRVGSVILATRDGAVLLVRSDRPAAGMTLWELPRGAGDAEDGDGIDTAMRELTEETGLIGRRPRVLGRYITDSSVYPQPVDVVMCEAETADPVRETDGEIDAQRWVPAGEIAVLVRDGVIMDAHSLAAIALWRVQEEEEV
ncbi:NUDIX hydrolase [Microbacterium sp. NPDC055903]